MNIFRTSGSRRNRTQFARLLASILLIGIVYSATFGSVHTHGYSAANSGTTISTSSAGQIIALPQVPLHSRTNGNDCLVCVLHRQFSSSTVHTPLFIAGPPEQIAQVSAPAVFYRLNLTISHPIARMSGRAPPLRRS
ncbi:MAG: hypothetical protein ACKVQJ_08685 [Pyrinomonadaceae bacterium]